MNYDYKLDHKPIMRSSVFRIGGALPLRKKVPEITSPPVLWPGTIYLFSTLFLYKCADIGRTKFFRVSWLYVPSEALMLKNLLASSNIMLLAFFRLKC